MARPFTPSSYLLHNMMDRAMARFDAQRARMLDPESFAYTATRQNDPLANGPARVVTEATRDQQYQANMGLKARTRAAAELVLGSGPRGLCIERSAAGTARGGRRVPVNDEHYPALNELRAAGLVRYAHSDGETRAVFTDLGHGRMQGYLGALKIIERAANPEPPPARPAPRSLAHRFTHGTR